jgi:hypothetical protein
MVEREDDINGGIDFDGPAGKSSGRVTPFADRLDGRPGEGTVALKDDQLGDGAVLADDGVKPNGPLEMLVARNAGVYGLNSLHQLCGNYISALANARDRRGRCVRVVLGVRRMLGPRTIRKVIRNRRRKNESKAAIDIGKREKAKELAAIDEAKFVERDGLETQLKRAESGFPSVIVAGLAEASRSDIGVVILKGPKEKGKDFRREMSLIDGVFCAFVMGDARTEGLEIPGGGIRENQALCQGRGARGVAVFLRLENLFGEVFEALGGVGEVEFQRINGRGGRLPHDGRLCIRS